MRKNKSSVSFPLASLANKYGISNTLPQNKENINAIGHTHHLGMNPNLNIEDEYIENLLKQAHFMNMEIKLIKEKQKESQGNGLWGVINRSKEPLINNIVESSHKYTQMKKTVDEKLNRITMENVTLANDQTALIKSLHFLEIKLSELQKKHSLVQKQYQDEMKIANDKITENSVRLQNILAQKELVKKKNYQMSAELQRVTRQGQREKLKMEHQLGRIRNDEVIEEIILKEKQETIDSLQNSIKILKEKFEQNVDYQRAQEEQTDLRKKIVNLDRNISGANFDLMQLTESIKLAEYEKDKQIRDRKSYTEDLESIKVMVNEILLMNLDRKQKETNIRKQSSPELRKAEEQTGKLEKNLQEIKKKLSKSEESQKSLKVEVDNYESELQKLKNKREEFLKQFEVVCKRNQAQDSQLMELENEIRLIQDRYERVVVQQFSSQTDLLELEKKLQYLRGRKEFLVETMDLKETMNGLKLEQLQRIVQKNSDLNETVTCMLGKWEEIKRFSKL